MAMLALTVFHDVMKVEAKVEASAPTSGSLARCS